MLRPYLMGHTEHERRRLSLQASIINPLTEQFLRRAGIGEGMRVLDLGCGVGEVSLLLARLVGSRQERAGRGLEVALALLGSERCA